MSKCDNQQIGIAGENFAAAELSKRNFIATITGKNTKGVDILCLNQETFKQTFIQVKTSTKIINDSSSWILSEKNEKINNSNFYYIFVQLNDSGNEYYIVPSEVVVKTIIKQHQAWLNDPNKNHNDTPIRDFHLYSAKPYKGAWDLLKNYEKDKIVTESINEN